MGEFKKKIAMLKETEHNVLHNSTSEVKKFARRFSMSMYSGTGGNIKQAIAWNNSMDSSIHSNDNSIIIENENMNEMVHNESIKNILIISILNIYESIRKNNYSDIYELNDIMIQ